MQVELAEERVFRLTDRFTAGYAEEQSWARRAEAFGALARVSGLFSQGKGEDYEVVYRERRLQPFWRLIVTTSTAYERTRDYPIKVPPEVRQVTIGAETLAVENGQFSLRGLESCREESRRETLVDGLTKAPAPALSAYLQHEAREIPAADLAAATADGFVVVPPQAKASMVVRDVVSGAIGKIDADRVLEEVVRVEAVDLFYRPIHAFRYRRAGKEAVMEFDGVTGEVKTGGATFEQYLGKALDPHFLLDVGGEALSLVIPGANIAKLLIIKGMELRQKR
jgi:hypothetical protein